MTPFPLDDELPMPEDLPQAPPSVNMGGPADPLAGIMLDEVFGEFEGADWGSDDEEYHDANLAQFLEPKERDKLAQNIVEWVVRDRQSRQQWEQREAQGIDKLGMSRQDIENTKRSMPETDWASTATHPGMMKACIQFWARATTELWPAGGPAKTVVLGASNPERQEQGRRVKQFLNYLYTQEMPGASQEFSQAIFRLPLSGSVFRKAYFDPVLGSIVVKFLESQDFVKPYSAVDLGSAARYTHIVKMTRNDLNLATSMGYYLQITMSEPTEESREAQPLDVAIDAATGVTPGNSETEFEAEYESRDQLYETSVTLDLADYGWSDPFGESLEDNETGDRISIGVPYRVTVHFEEERVLSIRRDWREGDQKKRRRRDVVEYKFLPGFGGYGYGLLHIAGGLSDAQTGFLRYLLDGCTLDTVGKLSGYVSQSAVGMRGLPPLELGKFLPVPGQVDDWKKSVMTPDFQWRSSNTLETLQYLDTLLDVLVASTESMIGDGNKDMPVGTILARIEQSSKPFAAIFTLLHASLGEELKAVADLAADYLPERYPYAVEGEDSEIFAADFDARVDVVPVSDPNIVSSTQRMAQAQLVVEQAQALVQIMGGAPEAVQAYIAAYANLLETMRVPDPERFIPQMPPPQPPQPPPPDPTEADISRKDATAVADAQRKDAEAVADQRRLDAEAIAEQQRQASNMQASAAARAQGDQAVRAVGQNNELESTAQEIMTMAAARQRQMAGDVMIPGAPQ